MKSRITIEIDFENNNEPFIEVLLHKSDDVRDKIIQAFTEKLSTNNLSVVYNESYEDSPTYKRYKIIPNLPKVIQPGTLNKIKNA
jgi:hypothetical protein